MMDFNPQAIDPHSGVAIFATDRDMLVKFRIHPELSQYKSKLAGVPVYDDIEVIEVRIPGEKEPVVVAATEWHKRRFPAQYEAFKKGVDQSQSGTPLDLLFPASPSTVKQLQSFHIYSIQQLAAISDSAKSQIPMGQSLVDRAKDYLRRAGDGQSHHVIEDMKKQIDELKAMLAESGVRPPDTPALEQEPVRRGPGRPRKEIQETV